MVEQIRVEVVGLKQLVRTFKNSNPIFRKEIKRAMDQAVHTVEAAAKTLVPDKTGNLRRSLHSEVKGMGQDIKGIAGTDTQYAPYVEFGTGIYHEPEARSPWTIRPVHAKALAIPVKEGGRFIPGGLNPQGKQTFRSKKGGSTTSKAGAQGFIFRQQVTIQGMKARPYLEKGFNESRAKIEEFFKQALSRINATLARGIKGGE